MHDLNAPSLAPQDVPTADSSDTTWPLHQMRGWYTDDTVFGYPQPEVPDPAAALLDPLLEPGTERAPAHRRQPARSRRPSPLWTWNRAGVVISVLMVVLFVMVCVLGLMFSYGLLGDLAHRSVRYGPVRAWPFIVFGPWLVGSLAVLRSAMDNHRLLCSWSVVVLFSAVTTTLCILDSRSTVLTAVIAGLPPVSSLVVLHQIVRQVSSAHRNRPSHARGVRPAKSSRRI